MSITQKPNFPSDTDTKALIKLNAAPNGLREFRVKHNDWARIAVLCANGEQLGVFVGLSGCVWVTRTRPDGSDFNVAVFRSR